MLRGFGSAISKFVLSVLSATLLTTSARADEVLAVTPSGLVEAVFDKSLPDTVSALGSFCMGRGWFVTSATANQVTCEVQLTGGQSIMGQLLLGNSYSTPPRQFVLFSAVPVGNGVRVHLQNWVELQMAFGQVRRTDMSGASFQNGALALLVAAGGRLPPGTTFPNHVYLGLDSDLSQWQGKEALVVTSIAPGSPAERGGVQVGDLIYEIAGKRWKGDSGYLDVTAKAAKFPTYPIQVVRSGKSLKLEIPRDYRPAVTEPVLVASSVAPPSPIQAALPPPSIADELSKLAVLREKGVLTEVEFQAQKTKLLAGNGQ